MASTISWSQDYRAEIQRIVKEFNELNSYQIEAEIKVSGEESFSFKASVKASKYGSRILTDNTEIIVNRSHSLAIDHDEKTIRIDKGMYKVKSAGRDQLKIDAIHEEMENAANVEYLGATDDYRTYVITNNKSSISKTVIKINKHTNFFHEIEVFYDSEDISIASYSVRYTVFKKNPSFKPSDFSQNIFYTKDRNGELTPTADYTEYRLIKHY